MQPDTIKKHIQEVWDEAVAEGADPRAAVVQAAHEAHDYWHSDAGKTLRTNLQHALRSVSVRSHPGPVVVKVSKIRALAGLLYPEYWADVWGADEPTWVWDQLASDYRDRLGIAGMVTS